MLISLLIFLLLSNAVTSRQDKSILFSRVVMTGLISSSYLGLNNLYTQPLEKGIGIYGGLYIELQSYGLYILSTLYRDLKSATVSGLTYFLLGGLSSCFILLGSALIYANSGTTSLDNIYIIASVSEITDLPTMMYWYQPYYLHLSLIIMSVGFLFKVSAAPFHFWSPDVYDGIPTIVTTYVAIIAKISIFAFFLELLYYTEYSILDFSWKNVLLLSSLFSLIDYTPSSLSTSISVLTLLLVLFIYIPGEWFNIVSMLSVILFLQ